MSNPAFAQLVSSHHEGLYRFALSLTGSEGDASDLVQQTFVTWAEKGRQLREGSRVKSWLFTTLYRAYQDMRRRTTRFEHHPIHAVGNELPTVSPEVVEGADSQAVLDALSQLDEDFRAPLVLFYLEDHSYKDIAEILELPIQTVMSRLSRAKASLRNALADRVQPVKAPPAPNDPPSP